jgi:acetyl/propionyl-CoA carboxylase alpha subunit
LLGVRTNRDFLIALAEDEGFANGVAGTDYLEENLKTLIAHKPADDETLAIVAATLVDWPFEDFLFGWNSRGAGEFPLLLSDDGGVVKTAVSLNGRRIACGGSSIMALEKNGGELRFVSGAAARRAFYVHDQSAVVVDCNGAIRCFVDAARAPAAAPGAGGDAVIAPMAGVVTALLVDAGDAIAKGQTITTIEAMKMEHQLKTPRDGVVDEVCVKEGDQIGLRSTVLRLKATA